MQFTSQLHGNKNNVEFGRINTTLYNLMRKLVIANELSERSIICVSGLQGAGKTTLLSIIEKFYYILFIKYLLILN